MSKGNCAKTNRLKGILGAVLVTTMFIMPAGKALAVSEPPKDMDEALAELRAHYESTCFSQHAFEAACDRIDEYACDPMFQMHFADIPEDAMAMLERLIDSELKSGAFVARKAAEDPSKCRRRWYTGKGGKRNSGVSSLYSAG